MGVIRFIINLASELINGWYAPENERPVNSIPCCRPVAVNFLTSLDNSSLQASLPSLEFSYEDNSFPTN